MSVVEVVELEGGARGARQDRWMRRAVLVAIVALFAASVAGLVTLAPKGKRTPAQQLAKLQAFVGAAKSVHYVADGTSESKDSTNPLSSSTVDKYHEEGDLAAPDLIHFVSNDGDTFDEMIAVASGTYDRSGDTRAEMQSSEWVFSSRDHTEDHGLLDIGSAPSSVMLANAADSLSAVGLADMATMLRTASAPKQVAPNVIEVSIDMKAVLERYAAKIDPSMLSDIPSVTARLTTGHEGELERMFMTSIEKANPDEDTGPTTSTDDIHFSRWGETISIAAPSRDTVDPTPGIDEKGLAAFTVMPLLAPRTIPAGYELTDAEVVTSPQDASPDDGNCPEVDLSYENPVAMAAFEKQAQATTKPENLSFPVGTTIDLTPASCDYSELDDNATPVKVGQHAAQISRSSFHGSEKATMLELVIGATRVDIRSDLPDKQLIALAASLAPLDLATQPVHHVAPPQ